jgi:uncharacterized protein YraI
MPKGARITVLEIKDGWARVTYNGRTGWCSADWIQKAAM